MNHPPDKKKQSEPSPSSPQQDAPRHIRQAQALIANHCAEEALAVCEQALAILPDDVDLLLTMATLLSVLGQFDKAIRRYTQLLERDEQAAAVLLRAVAYAHRGRVYLESDLAGKAARALSDGEQAMSLFAQTPQEEAHP
ncbi:MAG: tetratricopeptide repeat protein, partial [Ktedonobacteraceae bacterium]